MTWMATVLLVMACAYFVGIFWLASK